MSFVYRDRLLAESGDRQRWLAERAAGVTATDAAKLATRRSIASVAQSKVFPSGFSGNIYTDYGQVREPIIADWISGNFEIRPSTSLFHAVENRRHLATPDGIRECGDGSLELAEIKTTNKPWERIPRPYLRQIWWQQHVLDADRTLLVWEQHEDFVPVPRGLHYRWIYRDDEQIKHLVALADELLEAVESLRERAGRD
ncbi:MAG: YqaJ viral recombinase family protein [Microbacteriaceae bacterium]|nr:YqaJ viral recombinase family protein [Microbacteriaceae bacterium]